MSKANKLCVSLIVLGAPLVWMPKARAQSEEQPSVADAARKSRELKKGAAKPATVITNDTLEPEKPAAPAATPAVGGETNAPNAASTNLTVTAAPDLAAGGQAAGEPARNTASNEAQGDKNAQSAGLKRLKQQIAEKQLEVDLAQRALVLANENFYSRPDFSKDDEGKAKLEAMKSDLAQKQDELAELKAKLPAEASAEQKPASGEPEQSRQSSEPQSQSQSQSESQQQTQPQSRP